MGKSPNPVTILANGAGNSLDGSVSYQPVDSYLGAIAAAGYLLIALRAEKLPILVASSFIDSLGNPIQSAATNPHKGGMDPNFNNYTSIYLAYSGSNVENALTTQAGLLGTQPPPVAMTDSFTVMTGARQLTSLSFAANGLYGDSVGTSDSVNASGIETNLSGAVTVKVGGQTATMQTITPTTTNVLWFSYDAVTGIWRSGVNSPAVASQVTISAASRNGNGIGAICYPFGYGVTGYCGQWGFHRWALFNKAYMNGAVPADDTMFAAMIKNYAAQLDV